MCPPSPGGGALFPLQQREREKSNEYQYIYIYRVYNTLVKNLSISTGFKYFHLNGGYGEIMTHSTKKPSYGKGTNPGKEIQLCVSCGNLLEIRRKVKITPGGKYMGYIYKTRCGKGRRSRNPWIAFKCIEFRENEDQKCLLDFVPKRKV